MKQPDTKTFKPLKVRVPSGEWVDVKHGRKREFRTVQKPFGNSLGWPQTVVAWRYDARYGYDHCLIVVESTWVEPLGAISEESLRMEGVESLSDFRRRWCMQNKRRFPPQREMRVVRFNPFTEKDRETMATRLMEHLYGAWLEK